MSVIETKTAIHELVDGIQDEQFLQAVFTILEKQAHTEVDFWNHLSDNEQAAIHRGIADADAGRTKLFQDVLRKYQ